MLPFQNKNGSSKKILEVSLKYTDIFEICCSQVQSLPFPGLVVTADTQTMSFILLILLPTLMFSSTFKHNYLKNDIKDNLSKEILKYICSDEYIFMINSNISNKIK